MKVGMNLTVLEEADGMWILGDDEGHKYHLPVPFTGEASDLGGLISDIEAENDDYARTVIPLIKRILADDYSQTRLFPLLEAVMDTMERDGESGLGKFLLLTNTRPAICGNMYSPEATCSRPPGHDGDHSCEVADVDPETRLHLGQRTVKWPNV